jgi:hypothetical protein
MSMSLLARVTMGVFRVARGSIWLPLFCQCERWIQFQCGFVTARSTNYLSEKSVNVASSEAHALTGEIRGCVRIFKYQRYLWLILAVYVHYCYLICFSIQYRLGQQITMSGGRKRTEPKRGSAIARDRQMAAAGILRYMRCHRLFRAVPSRVGAAIALSAPSVIACGIAATASIRAIPPTARHGPEAVASPSMLLTSIRQYVAGWPRDRAFTSTTPPPMRPGSIRLSVGLRC